MFIQPLSENDGRNWTMLMITTAGNSTPNLYGRYIKVSAHELPSNLLQYAFPRIEYHAQQFSCLAYPPSGHYTFSI